MKQATIITCVALLTTSAAAANQNENTYDILIAAIELSKSCPSLEVNKKMAIAMTVSIAMTATPEDIPMREVLRQQWQRNIVRLGNHVCEFAEAGYGPAGDQFPNLLLKTK